VKGLKQVQCYKKDDWGGGQHHTGHGHHRGPPGARISKAPIRSWEPGEKESKNRREVKKRPAYSFHSDEGMRIMKKNESGGVRGLVCISKKEGTRDRGVVVVIREEKMENLEKSVCEKRKDGSH